MSAHIWNLSRDRLWSRRQEQNDGPHRFSQQHTERVAENVKMLAMLAAPAKRPAAAHRHTTRHRHVHQHAPTSTSDTHMLQDA